jgi:hypothetical protein
MKRFIVTGVVLILLFIIGHISATEIKAACELSNNGACNNGILCDTGLNKGLCCENEYECVGFTLCSGPGDNICDPVDCHEIESGIWVCGDFGSSDDTNQASKLLCYNAGIMGIDTAIGCIPVGQFSALIAFILNWALGIAGGIAFLLILYAGFIIMTSSGNPDRLKAGQELLTSAIMGIILLIFSIFILRILGVELFKIPGF